MVRKHVAESRDPSLSEWPRAGSSRRVQLKVRLA
jgi:hypothetical protein